MTSLRQALYHSVRKLKAHGIEDSHVEARVLLQSVTGLSAAEIYMQPERTLTKEEASRLEKLLKRRLSREPLAYITNNKEFYGLDFYVDGRVLIPRPETEFLVEAAIACATDKLSVSGIPLVADIGTGCGAIAVSLAKNLATCKIYATDVSADALEVARINARRHGVLHRITFLEGNLLEPLPQPVDIIAANLPYVSRTELPNLPLEIREFEPKIAIDGGVDGLEVIKQLLSQTGHKINPAGCLLLEIGQQHADSLASLVYTSFKNSALDFISDLNGTRRVARISFSHS